MQTDPVILLFTIAVFLMSAVIHEVSHGYVAYLLGDNTAKYQGRLTLNPLKHIDIFGSIILPILLYFSAGIVFGWAKPVPYNPYNLRDQRFGELKVAVAGPISNFIIAALGGLAIRVMTMQGVVNDALLTILLTIVTINVVLGLFNLIPIPPLDGSKIVYAFLPYRLHAALQKYESYGFFIVFAFAYFGSSLLYPLISLIISFFTGLPV